MTQEVYLLHFDQPLGNENHQAIHYIGSADDVAQRLQMHATGHSDARIMQVLAERAIGFTLARLWPGDRKTERALKNRKNAARLCPICRGESQGLQHFAPLPAYQ